MSVSYLEPLFKIAGQITRRKIRKQCDAGTLGHERSTTMGYPTTIRMKDPRSVPAKPGMNVRRKNPVGELFVPKKQRLDGGGCVGYSTRRVPVRLNAQRRRRLGYSLSPLLGQPNSGIPEFGHYDWPKSDISDFG
jgi:hypothetical protein